MLTNQRDQPVFTEPLFSFSGLASGELQQLVFQLLDHLQLTAVRTNATKHGDTQVLIQPNQE
jgi:hypothetical protein